MKTLICGAESPSHPPTSPLKFSKTLTAELIQQILQYLENSTGRKISV